MKLSKLREQAEGPVPSDTDETIRDKACERINMAVKRWKSSDKKFEIPGGYIRLSCIFDGDLPDKENKHDRPVIELGVTYRPNMNPVPVIPRDFLALSVDKFIEDLKELCPDMSRKESEFPHEVLNMYDVTFYSVTIYPSEGIINLFDFIPRPLYNMMIKTPRQLGDLLLSRSHLLNQYTFEEGVIPRFSEDYSKAMDKAVRKCKTVYTALEKGTWKEYKYNLTPFHLPNVVVHQERSGYTVESGVIHPDFSISYSGGWPLLNGEKINGIFPIEVQDEFMKFIKKRFMDFGINLS